MENRYFDKANHGKCLEAKSFCFTEDPFKQKEFSKRLLNGGDATSNHIPTSARENIMANALRAVGLLRKK
jgi:hypothetical protein